LALLLSGYFYENGKASSVGAPEAFAATTDPVCTGLISRVVFRTILAHHQFERTSED
jgi:hypothetical protein